MTIKEKAKAYDEALKAAKALCNITTSLPMKEYMEYIFPELKESEDERIRKELISMVKLALATGSSLCPGGSTTKEDAIAWLEKQKPAEWSEKDEKMYQSALWHIKNSCGNGCCIFNIIKPDDVPCNGYNERVEKCSAENNEQISFI